MSRLIPILVLVLALPAAAQQSPLERALDKAVARIEQAEGAAIWTAVRRCEQLGVAAIPLIDSRLKTGGLKARTRLGLGEVLARHGKTVRAREAWRAVMTDASVPLQTRVEATRLITRHVGEADVRPLIATLAEAREKGQGHLTVAAGVALARSGRVARGVRALRQALHDADEDVAAEAALALGELDRVREAKLALTRLATEPSHRGRLARQLLSRDSDLQQRLDGASLLDEAIEKIAQFHIDGDKVTREQLLTRAVKAIASAMDKHSTYWTPEEYAEFSKDMKGEYAGIGAYVGYRGGVFSITSPIYSGPAYRAGLRSRDMILEVDGWPTAGKSTDAIIKRVLGTPGTTVRLKVDRVGWDKARTFDIVRAKIEVKTIHHSVLPGKIGYMRCDNFGTKTAAELVGALIDFNEKGCKALILDLRDNTGGWLTAAYAVANAFLGKERLIVYSEGRHPKLAPRRELRATERKLWPDAPPMAILINGETASASEIVAGALKYHKRAFLVGKRTYGKGSVQLPLKLESTPGARIKLTIARYYLPDGSSIASRWGKGGKLIQKGGIAPDIEVGARAWHSWWAEAFTRIVEAKGFRTYLSTHYDKHKKLFHELAVNDGRDHSKYPGFEPWYAALRTRADKTTAREWLRDKIRERVADDRGRAFAHDLLEDPQLQRCVVEICKRMGVEPASFPGYRSFAPK